MQPVANFQVIWYSIFPSWDLVPHLMGCSAQIHNFGARCLLLYDLQGEAPAVDSDCAHRWASAQARESEAAPGVPERIWFVSQ